MNYLELLYALKKAILFWRRLAILFLFKVRIQESKQLFIVLI